jgi:uncharacterized cysteine cluster protein YcgN (CxxCxxCC family)
MKDQYWKRKSLAEMNADEWEGLCDGCALCCMHKLEDEDTGEIFYTDIACRLLDVNTCRCTDYANRVKQVADCLVLSVDDPQSFEWLPDSCAYRRLANKQELPAWHPLLTGDPNSVHDAGISVRGRAVSENDTGEYTVLRKMSNADE